MQKIGKFVLTIVLGYTLTTNAKMPMTCHGKPIFGGSEKIKLGNNLILDAKLDTGASMASISAQNIKTYELGNTKWIRFKVMMGNKPIVFNRPLAGYTHILNRQEENRNKSYSTRPVIIMPICIGNRKEVILINLADRSHFRYPVLIGSDALKKLHALVDVTQSHITSPNCN